MSLPECAQAPLSGAPRCTVNLVGMDTVRFGRVLGSGARSAAKTLIQAIDAAKAENPSGGASASSRTPPAPPIPRTSQTAASAERVVSQSASRVVEQGRGVRHGASRFKELALKPFVRLSGVLVLEIAGVFFGVFAMYGLNTMWRAHGGWHAGAPAHRQFLGGVVMLAVFGYFSVTSFLRARRRERRR